MRALLLPGLDGTGLLFERFQRALPETLASCAVDYGDAATDDALLARVELPDEPFAIVAESFSGPLAFQIAARAPAQLKAIVLVASFVRRPRAIPRWIVAWLSRLLFALPLPRWAVRWALLGRDAPRAEVTRVRAVLATVARAVLASRLRWIFAKDMREAFSRCALPVLYLGALRDRLVPRRVLDELLRLRPDVEHAVIDGPHLLLQERAAESAAVIAEFLRKLE